MNSMKTVVLLSTFLILGVCSSEACMNTDSVSVTSDTESVCPSQSVTARCVVTSTQTPMVLIWECEGQGGSMKERVILCSSGNEPILALNCKDGDVQLTLSSCTCNDSTITSDAMFVATAGSGRLTCTDNANQYPNHVSLGIEDPPTPVLSFSYSRIYDVEKNNFANVTIEWSSSGSEQYQYRVSISSPNSDPVTITTSATMINVTLEIGVEYSITVTAERCSGSVTSMTSEPLDIILPVPDAVETCEAVRAYNEGTLDHIELKWTSLMDNSHVSGGATAVVMGYEVSFVLNQTVSMVVPLPLSDLECTTNCQVNIMQNTLPDMPFHVSVAGENRFGIGQSTPCTGDTIGLRNVFLNVTEFNQTVIGIRLTVDQERISVYCGKEPSNLKLCATNEGPFDLKEPVHLDTLKNYTTEFQPNKVYYYEIKLGNIIVSGSVTSGELYITPSVGSLLTAGEISSITIVAVVICGGIVIAVVSILAWKSGTCIRQRKFQVNITSISTPSTPQEPNFQGGVQIPEDLPHGEIMTAGSSYHGKDIRGLCITETILICSDKENLIVFKRTGNEKKELQKTLIITGLNIPRGVCVDSDEKWIYVVESARNRILKFDRQSGTCKGESPSDIGFNGPRGIVAKNKWIFVCDTGKNEIRILDENLKLCFELHNVSVINGPQDIACLYADDDDSYTLCIAANNGTIVVLGVELGDQPRIIRETIITQSTMKIEVENNTVRSICVVDEKFIYVTEWSKGGQILCLNLKNGKRMDKRCITMDSEVWPKLIANHGKTTAYSVFNEGQYNDCDILFM